MDLSLKPYPNDWQLDIVLFAFLGIASAVYYSFAALLLRIFVARLQSGTELKLSKFDTCILVLGALGTMCILYGFLVEPYWLSVTHVKITSDKLHSAKRPIRLVHISDLHCDPTPRLEEKLPDVIAAEHPDIIVFTGDGINSPGGLPILQKCLKRLVQIAPTYVVKGNWDVWYFENVDRFGGTGVVELAGRPAKVSIAGADIWLCGLPAESQNLISKVMRNVPDDEFRIFAYHYPDFIELMAQNNIDLYLAGHTHGGQVALPFYGALITLSSRGKQFEHGLYEYKQTHLYVNRGIGMEGGISPRVRFCARPEVTVFELSGPNL